MTLALRDPEKKKRADAHFQKLLRKVQRAQPPVVASAGQQHRGPVVARRELSEQTARPMSLVVWQAQQALDESIVYRHTVTAARHYFDTRQRAISVPLSDAMREQQRRLLTAYCHKKPLFEFWPFQKEILEFMRQREYDREQLGCRGGMLCADMGLGKALMVLQHILSDNQRCAALTGERCNGATLMLVEPILMPQILAEMTSKWPVDSFQHCCIVTGDRARLHRVYVERYCDIVLTTYATLKCVYKHFYATGDDLQVGDEEEEEPEEQERRREYLRDILYDTQWKRIVADEAHVMLNPQTLIHAAVLRLRSPVVWAVTGTPVRHWNDVCSTFSFIGAAPALARKKDQQLQETDIGQLETLLKVLMVRLMKSDIVGRPDAPLFPALIKAIQLLHFQSPLEKTVYYMYAAYAMRNWRALLQSSEQMDQRALLERDDDRFAVKSTRANIAGIVQCMRQICINLKIVENLVLPRGILTLNNACGLRLRPDAEQESLFLDESAVETGGDHFSLMDMARRLGARTEFDYVYERELFESKEYLVLRQARGEINYTQLEEAAEADTLRCDRFVWEPMRADRGFSLQHRSDRHRYARLYQRLCRREKSSVRDQKEVAMLRHLQARILPADYVSTKNRCVMDYICQVPAEDKIIVFSDLVEALKCLGADLQRLYGIESCLMCGKTAATNSQQLAEFKRDPAKRVLLLSLRLCNVGLNIVEANHILFLDEWWNPNTGEQAENRVQRIGQKKTVYILHFVMNHTLETHIMNLLYKKRNISSAIVGDRASETGGVKRRKLDEERHEKAGNLFDYTIGLL